MVWTFGFVINDCDNLMVYSRSSSDIYKLRYVT